MTRKLNKVFKILAAGLICALASIFLFSGCAKKSSDKFEAPDAAEYGLYTNLTLTIDSGEGKVWATVKNAFTFMPSTVKVTVELYNSATYKEDYKTMKLAGANTVADLDIGRTLTTEASTDGRQMYWQARMFYKIDEKPWQEQTTKLWLIDGNGNLITQYVTPPKGENPVSTPTEPEIKLPDGTFTLKDIVDGEPLNMRYTRFRTNEPMPDIVVDEDGTIHMPLLGIAAWGGTDDAEIAKMVYDLFLDINFEMDERVNDNGYKYFINLELDSGKRLHIVVGRLGKVRCVLKFEDESEIVFASEENVIEIDMLNNFIDKYFG